MAAKRKISVRDITSKRKVSLVEHSKSVMEKEQLSDIGSRIVTIMRFKTEFTVDEKGGLFELPGEDGIMIIEPGSCIRRTTVTALLAFPTRKKEYCPPLNRFEKLISNIFYFSCKGVFTIPVRLNIPLLTTGTKFVYGIHKVHPKGRWTRIDISETNETMVTFDLEAPLGIVGVVCYQPHEVFNITKNGGLFYFRNAKYGLLRVPKGSHSSNIECNLRIIDVDDPTLGTLREDVECLKDIVHFSPFYDFSCVEDFKKELTLKLPLPEWSKDIENLKEKMKAFYKNNGQWGIFDSDIQFTNATATLKTKRLETFCLVIPRIQRTRVEQCMNTLFYGSSCVKVEILGFYSMKGNKCHVWIGSVLPNLIESTIEKHHENGLKSLKSLRDTRPRSQDLDEVQKHHIDIGFVCDGVYCYEGMKIVINVSGDMELKPEVSNKLVKDKDKELLGMTTKAAQISHLGLNDDHENTDRKRTFYFHHAFDDCFQSFEMKPTEKIKILAIKMYLHLLKKLSMTDEVNLINQRYGSELINSGIDNDEVLMRRANEYFEIVERDVKDLLEAEPYNVHSFEDHEHDDSESSNPNNVVLRKDVKIEKNLKRPYYPKVKDFSGLLDRHSPFNATISCSAHPNDSKPYVLETFYVYPSFKDVLNFFGVELPASRKKKDHGKVSPKDRKHSKVVKEDEDDFKVMSENSMRIISQNLQSGLQLGVHLKLPEENIYQIGNMSLYDRLPFSEVSYFILTAWKNSDAYLKKSNAERIEQLANAFNEIGRKDLNCILKLHFASNSEITREAFD